MNEKRTEPHRGARRSLDHDRGGGVDRGGVGERSRGVGRVATHGAVPMRAGDHPQRAVVDRRVVEEHDRGDDVLRRGADPRYQ